MKTLGIYYATACYRDEKGQYYTSPGLGRYLQMLHEKYLFDVVLLAPVTDVPLPHLRFPLPDSRVVVYELPYYETFKGAVRVRFRLLPALRRFFHMHRVNVMWLRYPAAYATELWSVCRRRSIPCFYEIVVDTMLHFKVSDGPPKLVRHLAMAVTWWHEEEMRRIAKTTPCVAVARSLARKFGDGQVRWLPASTVCEEEFYYREDTCLNQPYHVLFVGGLRREKSIDTLIEATAILQSRGYPVFLDIVGDGDQREFLEVRAKSLLSPLSYCFHGFQSDPAVIHRFYCQADLFALSSLTEGFPRVILEAMARGLPVVATDIVGIPDLVRHGETGLLVPVRQPESLADAIAQTMDDGVLRRRLIAGGYEVAKEHTLERFLLNLVDFIKTEVGVDLTKTSAE